MWRGGKRHHDLIRDPDAPRRDERWGFGRACVLRPLRLHVPAGKGVCGECPGVVADIGRPRPSVRFEAVPITRKQRARLRLLQAER